MQTRVYCSTPCRMKAAKERDQIRKAEEQYRASIQGYYRSRKPAVPVVTCWCGRKECRKHGTNY